MSIFSGIEVLKGLIHTFVRTIPLGLYFFTYFALTLFKDLRAGIILLGLILNDIFGYIYKKYSEIQDNSACAMFGNIMNDGADSTSGASVGEQNANLGFLPNTHIEIITFVAAFFYSDMWVKNTMDWFKFNFLTFMIVITIYSRMAIGCQNKIEKVIFNVIFGLIRGGLYYYFFADYYKSVERGVIERESCDLGYSNYKCETIKDGVVIVKHPYKNDENGENGENGENSENSETNNN